SQELLGVEHGENASPDQGPGGFFGLIGQIIAGPHFSERAFEPFRIDNAAFTDDVEIVISRGWGRHDLTSPSLGGLSPKSRRNATWSHAGNAGPLPGQRRPTDSTRALNCSDHGSSGQRKAPASRRLAESRQQHGCSLPG